MSEIQSYQQPIQPVQIAPKSPVAAVFMSMLIPGLGSMTSGESSTGVVILVCWLVSIVSMLALIGVLLVPVVWIWGMVHAHGAARRWNYNHGIIS